MDKLYCLRISENGDVSITKMDELYCLRISECDNDELIGGVINRIFNEDEMYDYMDSFNGYIIFNQFKFNSVDECNEFLKRNTYNLMNVSEDLVMID